MRAAHEFDCAVFKVACADGEAYGYAFEFVVGEFESGAFVVGIVVLDADTEFLQALYDGLDGL